METTMLERKDNPLLFWAGEQFVGACPNIKPLVEAVRALPGLADWVSGGHTMQVWRLLVLGMILRRIDDPSFLPLLEKIAIQEKMLGTSHPSVALRR